MDPTFNGALFYLLTVAQVIGLLVVAMSLVIGKGPVRYAMRRWEPETEPGPRYKLRKFARWVRVHQILIGAFLLFLFSAVFNLIIGVHAAVGVPAITNGGVDWYFHALRALQATGVWMFIRGLLRRRKYSNPPPTFAPKNQK